jgi:hypothetical protein
MLVHIAYYVYLNNLRKIPSKVASGDAAGASCFPASGESESSGDGRVVCHTDRARGAEIDLHRGIYTLP